MQIADWLKKLGMSEYAERFAENDIDTAVSAEILDPGTGSCWAIPDPKRTFGQFSDVRWKPHIR